MRAAQNVLEGDAQHSPDAPLVALRNVEIRQTAHVFDVKDLENVVNAGKYFDIGRAFVHHGGEVTEAAVGLELAGEVEQLAIRRVARQCGVVSVG